MALVSTNLNRLTEVVTGFDLIDDTGTRRVTSTMCRRPNTSRHYWPSERAERSMTASHGAAQAAQNKR